MKQTLIPIILALTIALTGCGQPGAPLGSADGSELPFGQRLQKVLDFLTRRTHGTGISAAVIIPDQGTWIGASGNSEPAKPITPDMLFDIASIGKNFVAVLVLQLAEEDRLSLDDPLGKWLPDYSHIDSAITIRQLLNHTSGIFDWVEHHESPFRMPFEDIAFEEASSPEEVVTTLVNEPYFPPGGGFHYSTTNYTLLRMIVGEVTQSTVSDELRRRFLDPLNLHHTVILDSAAPIPDTFNVAHDWWDADGDGTLDDVSARSRAWIASRSPADVYSTAQDLARWSQALYRGEVLSQESLAQMLAFHRPVAAAPGEPLATGYGLGTEEFRLGGLEMWGHLGWQYGYTAAMLYLPRYSASMTLLVNDNNLTLMNLASAGLWMAMEFHLARARFIAVLFSVLMLISIFTVWPAQHMVRYLRRRRSSFEVLGDEKDIKAGVARIVAIFTGITLALAAFFYPMYSLNPQWPLAWRGGPPMVKSMIALVTVGSVLSISLTVFAILAWKNRYWSIPGRVHYTLITLAGLIGAYLLLRLFF